MITPQDCVLTFAPTEDLVNAHIVTLTAAMIADKMDTAWWNSPDLLEEMDPIPIDRDWKWEDVEIVWEGSVLASEKVAVVTGDGYVQGAMLISSEGVQSELLEGQACLLVELLFTAPQNRPTLRTDGKKYFGGVGPQLLRWAAAFSRKMGHEGRLRLDGSPDFVAWYENLGFQKLDIETVLFEGVQYTPMEFSSANSQRLIDRVR